MSVVYDANVHALDHDGNNWLMRAAMCGDLAKVKYCVSMWADISVKSRKGHTALMLAVMNGHLHVVEYLLGSDCLLAEDALTELNKQDSDGNRCFQIAINGQDAPMTEMLSSSHTNLKLSLKQ